MSGAGGPGKGARLRRRHRPHTRSEREAKRLSQGLSDHLAVIDGGAFIAAVVQESEGLMIEAQEVQNRRMDVQDMATPFDRAQSNLVGGSDDGAASDATAGHPH